MAKIVKLLPLMGFLVVITMAAHYVGYGISPLSSMPGTIIIAALSLLGLLICEIPKLKGIPAIITVSLLGIIVTSPFSPIGSLISRHLENVNILALATPVLAFAGIGLGAESGFLKTHGARLLLVSLVVFTGTFLGAALIAEIILRIVN